MAVGDLARLRLEPQKHCFRIERQKPQKRLRIMSQRKGLRASRESQASQREGLTTDTSDYFCVGVRELLGKSGELLDFSESPQTQRSSWEVAEELLGMFGESLGSPMIFQNSLRSGKVRPLPANKQKLSPPVELLARWRNSDWQCIWPPPGVAPSPRTRNVYVRTLSEVNKRGRPSKWPPDRLPSKFADFECAFSL